MTEDAIRTSETVTMTPPASWIAQSADHGRKCQFALNAGYSRDQVETVLQALGPNATEDKILSSLVKLAAKSPHLRRSTRFGCESLSTDNRDPNSLRPIIIDGSNVALTHGNNKIFSCRGILLAVTFFKDRGHKEITVFVPSWRKEASRPESPITDQHILLDLESDNILSFTPSKRIGDKRIVCHDDRFILKLATSNGGVIVSNDFYRDWLGESPEWRETIEKRVLMYTFAKDVFMVPDDPLGKRGPTLEQFLKFDTKPPPIKVKGQASDKQNSQVCPYGERCTFGKKCRFSHPEREDPQTSAVITSGSSSPVIDQKVGRSSKEDFVQTRLHPLEDPCAATDCYRTTEQPRSAPLLDIEDAERMLSALNLVTDYSQTSDYEPNSGGPHLHYGSPERNHPQCLTTQPMEQGGHRCLSSVQRSLLLESTSASTHHTYPISQALSPGHLYQHHDMSTLMLTQASGMAEEGSSLQQQKQQQHLACISRDMNGQLLSRGILITCTEPQRTHAGNLQQGRVSASLLCHSQQQQQQQQHHHQHQQHHHHHHNHLGGYLPSQHLHLSRELHSSGYPHLMYPQTAADMYPGCGNLPYPVDISTNQSLYPYKSLSEGQRNTRP